MLRWLFWAIVAVFVLYSGYWFIGSRTMEQGATTWLDDRRAEGWAADATDVQTVGYPTRFDTTFTDIRLADPQTSVGWAAPFFQLFTLSYQPNAWIAVWPNSQTLFTPGSQIDVTSEDMRGSFKVRPNTTLALDQAVFDVTAMTLRNDQGVDSAVGKGLGAMRLVEGEDQTYDIFFEANDVKPGDALKFIIDPKNRLPDVFQSAKVDMRVTFDKPWDRSALEQARPQPTAISLREAQATWGQLDLRMAGDVQIDITGTPTGDVTIKARNWQDMLNLGAEMGVLPRESLGLLEGVFGSLARASGPPNTLDLPITLSGGQMRVGFIPIGKAPKIRLR